MFSDVSPIFVIFSTSFIMHSAALQDSTPGKMLHQYSNLVRTDTILVSDKDQVRAVCWFFKRNDVYSLAGRG
jgi:4-amino-4-deoxy-L-arabinose transferase